MRNHYPRATVAALILLSALTGGQFAYIIHADAEAKMAAKEDAVVLTNHLDTIKIDIGSLKADVSGLRAARIAEDQKILAVIRTGKAAATSPTVPIVTGIVWPNIAGHPVKALNVPLNMNVDVLAVMSLGGASPWNGQSLLPVAWPPQYVNVYRQEFNPYTFAVNASMLRFNKDAAKIEDRRKSTLYLLDQLAKYTKDDAIFYDFDYSQADGTFQKGWTSALGNGLVALGLLDLAEAVSDPTLRTQAKRYLDKLLWKGQNTDLTLVDRSSYLWFEETPPLNGKPTHILNGHSLVVFAMYRYMQVTGDRSYEPYVKAGLATAARYFWEARRPGGIPMYWRYDETEDYGPLRAINYADTMASISGHPIFSEFADALRTDVPIR